MRFIIEGFGKFMKLLLLDQEASSRFVYLTQGVGISLSLVVLTVVYVIDQNPAHRENYWTVYSLLLGGGVLSHVGRAITKGGSS